jgi:hypothetical protein
MYKLLCTFVLLILLMGKAYPQSAETKSDKPDKKEILSIIKLAKFDQFNYSKVSIVDAINQCTNKLFVKGIQVTLNGLSQGSFEAKKGRNGAIYYTSVLQAPLYYDFFLKNVTLKEVLDHISYYSGLDYDIKEGEIAFTDKEETDKSAEEPEDGFIAGDLQRLLKLRRMKDTKNYRGKTFKVNGLLTGIGRGTNSKIAILAIDGGLTRIEIERDKLVHSVYKRIQFKISNWKKEDGPKILQQVKAKADREYEILDTRKLVPDLFIVFEATLVKFEGDRIIFKDPKYIFFEEEGKYLYRRDDEEIVE